jgi:hypothetical protein
MIIRWYGKDSLTTKQLIDLGIGFIRIYGGQIDTGNIVESPQFDGKVISMPITKQGISIEFKIFPNTTTLSQIDELIPNCIREGTTQRNLAREIDDLKIKVAALEIKVKRIYGSN